MTPESLTEAIGVEPDSSGLWTRRRPFQASWRITEEGTGEDDLTAIIDSVLTRVEHLRGRLAKVCAADDTRSFLKVVAYVGEAPVGPGFAIASEHVALLAELGASLDIDQYLA